MENTDIKVTCLHQEHIDLGAVMSPFAGFDMPIRYKEGIIAEHNAVRNAVGVFDVSHMGEIIVSGPQATEFVNHIFTNDVTPCKKGDILYGMMLNEGGGVVDDLLVYCGYGPDSYLLVVNAANIEKDYKHLKKIKPAYKVVLANVSDQWGQLAIQGPKAEETILKLIPNEDISKLAFYTYICFDGLVVSRTGYTGEDGFEVYAEPERIVKMWKELIAAGVQPCGLGCRDTLRFEAGLPLYGDELSETISPVMAGLSMFCKLDKEEFIGKEALVRQKTNGVARRVVGLELNDRAIARAGYPVETLDERQIGVVTTGYHSITLDKSICFALVDSQFSELGTNLLVRIRNKAFECHVVKKRFYSTKYKK